MSDDRLIRRERVLHELAKRRADAEFMTRIRRRVVEDRRILERLAQGDSEP